MFTPTKLITMYAESYKHIPHLKYSIIYSFIVKHFQHITNNPNMKDSTQ